MNRLWKDFEWPLEEAYWQNTLTSAILKGSSMIETTKDGSGWMWSRKIRY